MHCIFLILLRKVYITYFHSIICPTFSRVPLHHISTQFLSKVEDIEKITREMTLHYIKERWQDLPMPAGSWPPGFHSIFSKESL